MQEQPKNIDVIALGGCYLDINIAEYPFAASGIPTQTELVGGAYQLVAGGSAVNFCRLLQQLQLATAFVGVAGNDVPGDGLEAQLRQAGVQPLLSRRSDLQTGISFNMTNPSGEHIMLVAGTANAHLTPEVVLPKLADALPIANMLFVGGCFKLTAFKDAFAGLVAMAAQYGCKLAVDHARIPAGTDESMRSAVKNLILGADYYFPSRDEFCDLWKVADISQGLQQLQKQSPKLATIVKDGANGAYYVQSGEVQHVPGLVVDKVGDVTGAGDSFNAGVIAALTKKHSLRTAVEFGCAVAAAKISGQSIPGVPEPQSQAPLASESI